MTSLTSLFSCLVLVCLSGGPAPARSTDRLLKVAMCQIFALDGDREGNFVRIEAALREARAQGAAIACFPETTVLGRVNPQAHERAHPIPGADTDRQRDCEIVTLRIP